MEENVQFYLQEVVTQTIYESPYFTIWMISLCMKTDSLSEIIVLCHDNNLVVVAENANFCYHDKNNICDQSLAWWNLCFAFCNMDPCFVNRVSTGLSANSFCEFCLRNKFCEQLPSIYSTQQSFGPSNSSVTRLEGLVR